MSNKFYSKFFPGKDWSNFKFKIISKLERETILITALPDAGISFFMKNIEEDLAQVKNDNDSIIISLEILPNKPPYHLAKLIKEQINIYLAFPKKIADLSCVDTIKILLKENKKIVIIINRFERLQTKDEALAFLNSLRAINPVKVRFLISCYTNCITHPENYKASSMLTTANVEFLPTFSEKEIEKLLKVYKEVYSWNVSKTLSKEIYKLSGGFPGFVKYIVKFVSDNQLSNIPKKQLIKEPSLNFKINNFLRSLEENDLIKNGKFNQYELLRNLGVFDSKNTLKIGLLGNCRPTKISKKNIKKNLSVQELKLFKLFSKTDEVITLDQAADTLWADKSNQKFSLWSIYKVISNLNKKIKKYGLKIENFKGRGYALTTLPGYDQSQAQNLLDNNHKKDSSS